MYFLNECDRRGSIFFKISGRICLTFVNIRARKLVCIFTQPPYKGRKKALVECLNFRGLFGQIWKGKDSSTGDYLFPQYLWHFIPPFPLQICINFIKAIHNPANSETIYVQSDFYNITWNNDFKFAPNIITYVVLCFLLGK